MQTSPVQAELSVVPVGDITQHFRVPSYQRGYRWTPLEVGHLLEDIWRSEGERYRLQPVVVQPLEDGRWDLVDGQQRLTTIFLIFQYMKNAGLQNAGAPYTLTYETREDSADFLQGPVAESAADNIDFHYMHRSYTTIREWFEKRGHRIQHVANKFYGYLFDSVEVIWYQVPEGEDEVELFTRLNVGRIALTDAELLKALLLSPPADATEQDRSVERAAQWDAIERDLQSPEVWAFVAGDRAEPTHISLLLDVLADRIQPGGKGRDRPPFHTFETLRTTVERDRDAFWEKVVDLHSQLIGWYENPHWYHRVGFLTHFDVPFDELIRDAHLQTKRGFVDRLDERIRDVLNLTEQQLRDLTYQQSDACNRVLLLMNVETMRTSPDGQQYSFAAQAEGSWSLEHLHAQRSKELSSEVEWREWLRLHADALADLPGVDAVSRDDLVKRINQALAGAQLVGGTRFTNFEQEVYALYEGAGPDLADDVDAIDNLALLGARENSALNNSIFEAKRRCILDLDQKGAYIPVCTRNAFLKYYTGAKGQQVHFWGPHDRSGYLDAMVRKVSRYLRTEGDAG